VATRKRCKRCKGTKKNGAACTAWAKEGGLCYFHANPDKTSELGKLGRRSKSPAATSGAAEYVARPRPWRTLPAFSPKPLMACALGQ
jgi:hypothetical protein